jgi:aubergine-like protein
LPQFEFNLYRVDFDPQIQIDKLRKRFIYEQREFFGGYLFDGQNMIYVTRNLGVDVKVFNCESREGEKYKMTIKNTKKKIEMSDGMAMQVLNVILRRTMEGLKMQEVGRNLYDPLNKVRLIQS